MTGRLTNPLLLLVAYSFLTPAPTTARQAKQQSSQSGIEIVETPRGSAARIYSAPVDKVFVAAAQVVAQKWHLTLSDKDTYAISFSSSGSMRSKTGSDMTVICMDMPEGRTKVLARSQKPQNTKGQVFDWNAGGKVVGQFFDLLESRLRELALLPKK